jgi:hypothetical protein
MNVTKVHTGKARLRENGREHYGVRSGTCTGRFGVVDGGARGGPGFAGARRDGAGSDEIDDR